MGESFHIALVVPPGGYFAERWRNKGMPELGLLYIAAVLEQNGYQVSFLPSSVLGFDFKALENRLIELRPDLVGVTCTTENRFQSFELLRRTKACLPDTHTVIGGPHVTNTARDTLEHLPEIDYVVRGEGELTCLDLCRTLHDGLEVGNISGLSWRDDSGLIIDNPARQPIPDLNELPFPARHLVDYSAYNFCVDVPGRGILPAANIMTSRGCPFNCNFCATPANWGRKVRTISPERVLDEIEEVYQHYGARVIWFYDDTFNLSRQRVDAICRGIMDRKLDIAWFCEVRVDLLDFDTLKLMRQAGCFHVAFGIESGSERIRREIVRKDFELDQARQIVDWCHQLQIIANPFFIVSHPTETKIDLEETFAVMKELAPKTQQSISILHVYPGTDLEKYALEHGLLPADFTWTRPDRRIITLPAAQGEVPLFLDRLSWWQLGRVLFQWSSSQGYSVGNKIPTILKNIRSFKDIYRYAILFFCFCFYRYRHIT
ncbi:cobalamin-dependent protein [bacterium]|nr:cobalamin-dependent protein [bacterium]